MTTDAQEAAAFRARHDELEAELTGARSARMEALDRLSEGLREGARLDDLDTTEVVELGRTIDVLEYAVDWIAKAQREHIADLNLAAARLRQRHEQIGHELGSVRREIAKLASAEAQRVASDTAAVAAGTLERVRPEPSQTTSLRTHLEERATELGSELEAMAADLAAAEDRAAEVKIAIA